MTTLAAAPPAVHVDLEMLAELERKLGFRPCWLRKGVAMSCSPRPRRRRPYEYLVAHQTRYLGDRMYEHTLWGLRPDDLESSHGAYTRRAFLPGRHPCEAVPLSEVTP